MAKPSKKKTTGSKKSPKKPLKALKGLVKKLSTKLRKPRTKTVKSVKTPKAKAARLENQESTHVPIPLAFTPGSLPTSPAPAHNPVETPAVSFELPASYGDDKIALLVRDPWWIYAYWEVTAAREAEVMRALEAAGAQRGHLVLRVYDVTGGSIEAPRSWFDIEVSFLTGNWYIDVGIPDRDWITELGIRARDGRFFMLVRSNVARTPRFGVSDVLDEEWMLPDEVYWKLFGLSGGLADRKSSLDVRDILEKYLKSIVSSAGMSSFGRPEHTRPEIHPDFGAKILDRPSSG